MHNQSKCYCERGKPEQAPHRCTVKKIDCFKSCYPGCMTCLASEANCNKTSREVVSLSFSPLSLFQNEETQRNFLSYTISLLPQ